MTGTHVCQQELRKSSISSTDRRRCPGDSERLFANERLLHNDGLCP